MTTPPLPLGHAATVQRLVRAADHGALTHAILFTGADGVGKTTAALRLASLVLDADGWPGGAPAHPDLWVEDGDTENLSIERMRAGGREAPTLQDFLALRPYAGQLRVAVLGRADRLTEQAANCLLKSIEEPPPGTHLLLTAAHPEKLPATVLSRCEQIGLGPVPTPLIAAWLTASKHVSEEVAAISAPLACGAPGRALRLATEPRALSAELDALDSFLAAGGGGTAGALRASAAAVPSAGAEGREEALATLGAWASFVRDAACFASGAPELGVWRAYRPALERWAEDLPATRIVDVLQRIVQACESIALYAQPRLTFDSLLMDIFAGPDSPPAVEVPERPPVLSASVESGERKPRSRGPRRPPPRASGSGSR